MSDLLVVVPPGWTDFTEGWIVGGESFEYVNSLIANRNWVDLTYTLRGADINGPDGSVLTGATFMSMDDGIHLWLRFE